jgi:acyl-coenzyme A thioesterase PaaI-like protein
VSTASHRADFRPRDAAEGSAETRPGAAEAEACRDGSPGTELGETQGSEPSERVEQDTDRAETAVYRRTAMDRVDAFVSRLAARNNFWQRLASLFWLPYAFKSGIRMKRIDRSTFSAVLPFRRFNRNWYNAMAGAALLANSEVAGGMYVFGICGGEYEVVCKHLEYKFLRPCFGPAVYRIAPREDVEALAAAGEEFNVTLDLDVVQQLGKRGRKERRVGRCVVTFHVTPKTHQKVKGRKV